MDEIPSISGAASTRHADWPSTHRATSSEDAKNKYRKVLEEMSSMTRASAGLKGSPSNQSSPAPQRPTKPEQAHCAVCGAAALSRCSKCKKVWYCSTEHQRTDWSASHRHTCHALASAPSPSDSLSSMSRSVGSIFHAVEMKPAVRACQEEGSSECTICFATTSDQFYKSCCGKTLCMECAVKLGRDQCAFCRTPCSKSEAEEVDRLRNRSKKGDGSATHILGYRCMDGEGVTKDEKKGIRLLHQAAEQGSASAQTDLAH